MPTTAINSTQKQVISAGSAPFLMARLLNLNGTYVTIEQMSGGTITAEIFDLYSSNPRGAVGTISLTPSQVLFDTIQLPSVPAGNLPIWSADETGYNFGWQLPSMYTQLQASGPDEIRVEIWAYPASPAQQFKVGEWNYIIQESLTFG